MTHQLDQHFIVFVDQNGFIIAKITKINAKTYTMQCLSSDLKRMIGQKRRIPIAEMQEVWRYIPEKQLASYLKLYS